MRFLGAAEHNKGTALPSELEQFSGETGEGNLKKPHAPLVIEEAAFIFCKNMKKVVFDPEVVVEEIGNVAFCGTGLESFEVPPAQRDSQSNEIA